MKNLLACISILAVAATCWAAPVPSFDGAEGFGATARGGAGGRIIEVTTLADDLHQPPPGSLRWAIAQSGPRMVQFKVAGNLRMAGPLTITEPWLTLDGSTAPGLGVCLCDHSLEIEDTHDIVVRYLRVRLGDVSTLAKNQAAGLKRPKGSGDLDCINAVRSSELLFDHVSASWSNDEVFGIVGCQNVTIQWCIISEPLSNPELHPYGDNHAFGLNLSASTLSLHHSLIAHYVMRGPQFEANDMRRGRGYDPKFESVNNVLFDYQRSGSRYTTGIEDHPDEAADVKFAFQFLDNYYLASGRQPEIEAVLRHGVIEPLRVYVAGNLGPNRTDPHADQWDVLFADKTPMRRARQEVQAQVSDSPLFNAPIPVTRQNALEAYEAVLSQAGCSHRRDTVDQRIIDDVRQRRTGRILRSQADVGGWPELK
ncbi:MAG TPA: hypothetical protein VHZ24_02740 [Pirellulales bacterium]|nr:hypothetical protein [Pirellulales bacterium]